MGACEYGTVGKESLEVSTMSLDALLENRPYWFVGLAGVETRRSKKES